MDIDIDFQTTFTPTSIIPKAVRASMIKEGVLSPHPCGFYLQDIPVDLETNLAAIPHDVAGDYGFFKIDFLHLSLLDRVKSKDHVRELASRDPDWKMLLDRSIVEQLFQIHKHYDVVSQLAPRSVIELADAIALIRPAKKHLIGKYIKDRNGVRNELYTKPSNGGYYYKKSHAVSYALTIVLQLNLMNDTTNASTINN